MEGIIVFCARVFRSLMGIEYRIRAALESLKSIRVGFNHALYV